MVYELRICDPGVATPHTTRRFPDENPTKIGKHNVGIVKKIFDRESNSTVVIFTVQITISVDPGATPTEVSDQAEKCGQ